jgi:hypothetical protein
MIDLSFVGKNGLMIDYEDIISLIGFNVVRYFRIKEANTKAMEMSLEDIFLSYINRENEDPAIWLKNEFGIEFNISDCLESINTFQPNWLYSYKIFDVAYKNGTKKLMVHSDIDTPIIRKILKTYTAPIEYVYGDIVPILERNKNITYLTASSKNLKRCLETNIPCAITIVDDFLHTADVVIGKIDEKLRETNKFVCYTSITSGGLINLNKKP